jgi:telomere length regulation protein
MHAAPSLISRKATFGSELSEHAIELAQRFCNLNDNFEMPSFEELRLSSMTALVVAQPTVVAPYFASQFFEGEYSMFQRAIMLSAISLGARILAGLEEAPEKRFPSKLLPQHLHERYFSTIDDVSSSLERASIAPLSEKAADHLTGPDVLKVRRFSRRPEIEAKRAKPKANALASIVGESFFYPLTGRWWLSLREL